jgi:teichuronic acid biosynthesis glycosyltransferase TuaH
VPDKRLLWLAGVPWDGIPGVEKQMVAELTRHSRVLWVDPPVSPATPTRLRHGSGRTLRPSVVEVDDRVTRLTPVALPGLSRPGIRLTTPWLVRRQVKATMRRLGMQPSVVVATYLQDMLGYWGAGIRNVLYGTDDYVAGAELMHLSVRYQRKRERLTVRRADQTIVVTPPLGKRWSALGADPQVVLPGCVISKPVPRAAGLPDLPRPVVGVVGQLSERVDIEALAEIAAAGFSLMIVGPVDPRWTDPRFAALISMPNVHHTGPVPPDRVPAYLAAFDIGLTPYRDIQFNRSGFPLKTLEYLGAGIPAISADLPSARWLREDYGESAPGRSADLILELAASPAEYVAKVRVLAGAMGLAGEGAAARPGPAGAPSDYAARCIEFAARHSYAERADEFAAAIGLAEAKESEPASRRP